MKVRHLIFLLMVTAFSTPRVVEAQSGDWVNEGTLVQQGDVLLNPTTMRPYTGRVFRFFNQDPSKVSSSYNLRDGLTHGPWESYYLNGQLHWKANYSNGKLHGPLEQYYENGQLWWREARSNGNTHGLYESYSEDGRLRTKGNYSNGYKCGEWIEDGDPVTYDPCPSN